MPTAREHLSFAYPFLLDPADPRSAEEDVIAWAEDIAAEYRPTCLSAERQNLAQAHYMAYVLLARVATQAASGSTTNVTRAPVVIEEQQGDVRVRYGNADGSTTTVRSGSDSGPMTAYAAWRALAEICGPIAGGETSTPGVNTTGPRYRGGIITRRGWPS